MSNRRGYGGANRVALGSVGSLDDLKARLGCASKLGGSAELEPPRNGLTGHVAKGVTYRAWPSAAKPFGRDFLLRLEGTTSRLNAASPWPSAGVAVELARRRVSLYVWILETRPRSRATTSNVLKLGDKV